MKKQRNKPFDSSLEMGILIPDGAIHKYARAHGHAALGELMDQIGQACDEQNRELLSTLPLVGRIITRPKAAEQNA